MFGINVSLNPERAHITYIEKEMSLSVFKKPNIKFPFSMKYTNIPAMIENKILSAPYKK